LEKIFLVVAFLETAFLGKKIPWSVVQPIYFPGIGLFLGFSVSGEQGPFDKYVTD
jgi:hypothetical protein